VEPSKEKKCQRATTNLRCALLIGQLGFRIGDQRLLGKSVFFTSPTEKKVPSTVTVRLFASVPVADNKTQPSSNKKYMFPYGPSKIKKRKHVIKHIKHAEQYPSWSAATKYLYFPGCRWDCL
jgi:hypothetical protein